MLLYSTVNTKKMNAHIQFLVNHMIYSDILRNIPYLSYHDVLE